MKRVLFSLFVAVGLAIFAGAQQAPSDAPASKADVERYLQVTHSRDMMKQMIDVMSKQMRQMADEQIEKNAPNLPPDAQERMDKMMDEMLKEIPIDDMIDVMIPVYQKHWTKGDVDALVAFYSSPTGQKMIKEMPATMAEAMQAMTPIMQKTMEKMTDRVQTEVAQMIEETKSKTEKDSQSKQN